MADSRFPSSSILELKETEKAMQLPKELENIVLDFTHSFHAVSESSFGSTHYDPAKIGFGDLGIFQNRLPVITLLRHAVRGEFKEVDSMLTKNPSLLLEADTVIDFSGRRHIERTVYQLVLGAMDGNVKNAEGKVVVNGMIEMIEAHFKKLPHQTPEEIAAIMKTQYGEQYPLEYKEIEEKQEMSDAEALAAIMNVIKLADNHLCGTTNTLEDRIYPLWRMEKSIHAKAMSPIIQSLYGANSDEDFQDAFKVLKEYLINNTKVVEKDFDFTVLEALYRFRYYWESKTRKPMLIGKHFNHEALQQVIKAYEEHYKEFGAGIDDEYNAPKNILCWQKIFGYVLRFVPACDAQVIAQGVRAVLQNKKFLRSLVWSPNIMSYYPLSAELNWEIGYRSAAWSDGRNKFITIDTLNRHPGFLDFLSSKLSDPLLLRAGEAVAAQSTCVSNPSSQ